MVTIFEEMTKTLLLLLLMTAVTHLSGQDRAPVVAAPAGTFRGTTEWSPHGQPFTAFLGIPYAQPPVGQLRFSKPEPLPRIQGVYDATKRGPMCIQPQDIDLGYPSEEDCLYLNVYVPSQKDVSTQSSKKVLFYIHGGGGFMGSANEHIPGELVATGVLISGSGVSQFFAHNDSHTLLNYLSNKLGCQHANLTATVQCLRSRPAESFVIPIDVKLHSLFISEDGELLTSSIPALTEDARYLREVGFHSRDYLVSLTNMEGPILLQGVFALGYDIRALTPKNLTNLTHWPLPVSEKVITWYRDLRTNTFLPAFNIAGDLVFAMPTFNFLKVFSSGNSGFPDRKRESYFILLDHMPTYIPQPFVGFYHALDLSYVFDLDPSDILKIYYRLDAARGYTEEEMEMRRVYQSIVVDFMTTGNPGLTLNRNMTAAWRPFDPDNEYFLSLNHRPSVQQFPLEDRRAFWTKTFPQAVEALRVQDLLKDEL